MSTPNSYGGDEITAAVLDPGSFTTKVGYAGEEYPRRVFKSIVASDGGVGDTLSKWKKGTNVHSVIDQGLVVDWDGYEQIWENCFKELGVDSSQLPLLLTDPEWNLKESREKILELGFEKFKLPGMYLGRSSVLSAFSVGKSTALVIDVGSSKTSVVPIHDGYVLRKGVQVQNVGGDFISNQILLNFEKAKIPIVPQYLVSSKTAVDSGQAPVFEQFHLRRSETTESYHEMQVKNTIDDFKETICAVSEVPFNPNVLVKKAIKNYEFPNGYNYAFRIERFRLTEGLFDPRYIIRGPEEDPATASHAPMMHMIRSALNNVDIDLRSLLLSNIVLMGGATLMHGFGDRIYNEIYNGIPGVIYLENNNRQKLRFMLLLRQWKGNLDLGLVVLFSPLWVLSINCGYQNSNTRKWEQRLKRNFINSIRN